MPVFRKSDASNPARALPYNSFRPITAAAVRVKTGNKQEAEQFRARRTSAAAVWQSEAWEYYDAIPEIKYAFNLVANVVSRIRLYTAIIDDPSEAPVTVQNSQTVDSELAGAAQRALDRLSSAFGGQAGLLRDAALNLSVVGECYLVQQPEARDPRDGIIPESWDIRSIDELRVDMGGHYMIVPRRDAGGASGSGSSLTPGAIPLPDSAFMTRIWRPHPRYSGEADSSLRGLLDLCAELLLLGRAARATERSRLNAGAMYVPDGLSIAHSPDEDYPYGDDESQGPNPEDTHDEFEEALIEAMTTPIEDESSASAVVPLIIRGPADLGEKIKILKFERAFDAAHEKHADVLMDRILTSLDVPKDIITGMANVKYSNAVQIDESLYKAHIEPMLLLISDSLTAAYLRPYLLSLGYDPAIVNRIVVWYDPSSVSTRNDRAADADAGFDKMAVSFNTWRRAHGFSDADAPTPTELVMRMVAEKGTIAPETVEAILRVVAPDVMNAARDAAQSQSVAPVPGAVDQILNGAPGAAPDGGAPPADAGGAPPVPLAEPGGAPTPDATPPAPSADNGADPTATGMPPGA